MAGAEDQKQPDPGGVQAAVDRYRDLAKYLITIFAGVGGLLVAGTQFSSIGKLEWTGSWSLDRGEATVLGLALALLAVFAVIAAAVQILKPIEMSLEDVIRRRWLCRAATKEKALPNGLDTPEELRDLVSSPLLTSEAEREQWDEVVEAFVGWAAFRVARRRFAAALAAMLVFGLIGTAGLTAFSWGANPPESETADPVVRPDPVVLTFRLTDAGRDTLGEALGAACAGDAVRALSIGGTEKEPLVVVLPEGGCDPAQFVLTPELGVPVSTEAAP